LGASPKFPKLEKLGALYNDRQKWFLNQTGKGIRVSSSELAAHWDISQKTAKRDIADLKQKGLIEFSGAPKNGYYSLKS
jgi:predicted HTH transcriptional regulator